jgi:hypothetical protein
MVEADKTVAPKPKRNVDYDLLTDEDKARLTKEAEDKIGERAKLEAERAFYAKEVERLERVKYPEIFEEKLDIRLDLALYARIANNLSGISLDGKHYLHGGLYTVPISVYRVLKEQEQATHRHEASLHEGDPYHTFYRRERALQANVKNDPASIQISSRGGVTAGGRPFSTTTSF